jgi:hypothetical protein
MEIAALYANFYTSIAIIFFSNDQPPSSELSLNNSALNVTLNLKKG